MEKSCLSSGETGKQQDPLSEKEASLCSATISEKQNTSCGCLFSQRKEHYDFLQKKTELFAIRNHGEMKAQKSNEEQFSLPVNFNLFFPWNPKRKTF